MRSCKQLRLFHRVFSLSFYSTFVRASTRYQSFSFLPTRRCMAPRRCVEIMKTKAAKTSTTLPSASSHHQQDESEEERRKERKARKIQCQGRNSPAAACSASRETYAILCIYLHIFISYMQCVPITRLAPRLRASECTQIFV